MLARDQFIEVWEERSRESEGEEGGKVRRKKRLRHQNFLN